MAQLGAVALILISMAVCCYSDTHPANATADHEAAQPAASPVTRIKGIDGVALSSHGSAEIRCRPTIPGAELVWFKKDEQLILDEKKYIYNLDNSSLTIKDVDSTDLGVYQCQESEDLRANVTLYSVPFVRNAKSSVTANPGYNVTMECRVTGLPKPIVTWFIVDKESGAEQPIVVDGRRFIVEDVKAINDRLIVTNLTYNDSRLYSCMAVNLYGSNNGTTLVRVKSQWRGIWPIFGILIQVIILAIIIYFYERKKKQEMEVEKRREAEFNKSHPVDTGRNDGVRQRKSN